MARPAEIARKLIGGRILAQKRFIGEFFDWRKRNYAAPSPNAIKRAVIKRNSLAGVFVETGTYLGDTTEFATSFSTLVISLEPDAQLFAQATKRFKSRADIELIGRSSEEAFAPLVARLAGPVTFWLDGHYSGAGTFLGSIASPIIAELEAIASKGSAITDKVVLVDDVRYFGTDGYPAISHLIAWAQSQKMAWHIEHDIFIMRSEAER